MRLDCQDYPALGVETPTAQGEAILLFNEVARCLPVLTSVFRVVTVAERSHAVSGGETCISAGNPVTSFHLSGTATARPTKCVCTSAACPSHGRRVAVTLVERVIEVPEHVVLACDGGYGSVQSVCGCSGMVLFKKFLGDVSLLPGPSTGWHPPCPTC